MTYIFLQYLIGHVSFHAYVVEKKQEMTSNHVHADLQSPGEMSVDLANQTCNEASSSSGGTN